MPSRAGGSPALADLPMYLALIPEGVRERSKSGGAPPCPLYPEAYGRAAREGSRARAREHFNLRPAGVPDDVAVCLRESLKLLTPTGIMI